jgi:hypothetical protein
MASQPSSQQHPNPGFIFEELGAYQRSLALKGAIELDLFTIIDSGAKTAAEIAAKAKADPRGVRILCDTLTVYGHLTKQGGEYALTPTSKQFLSKNARSYMGTMIGFLLHDVHMSSWADVAAAVRHGGTVKGNLITDESIWVEFARAMAPMAYGCRNSGEVAPGRVAVALHSRCGREPWSVRARGGAFESRNRRNRAGFGERAGGCS